MEPRSSMTLDRFGRDLSGSHCETSMPLLSLNAEEPERPVKEVSKREPDRLEGVGA